MSPVRPYVRAFTAVFALCLGVSAAFAFPAVHHKRDLRAEVEAVDSLWRSAQQANDVAAMDKLLSDDYLGIMGNGQAVTKAQQLERVTKRMTQLSRLEISDVKTKLVGHSAAIVTSLAELDGMVDGRTIHGSFRSMRVYQRTPSGVWRLTSFEATPLRGPGSHPAADDIK